MFGVIAEMVSCPICGMPAVHNNYHVTGEESVTCDYCGYTHEKTFSGKKTSKGYGCIHYVAEKDGNDIETVVRLKSPMSLIGRHEVVMDIQNHYSTEKSSFFIWDDEKKELECIIGSKPMTLEEYYEQQNMEAEYWSRMKYATHPDDML